MLCYYMEELDFQDDVGKPYPIGGRHGLANA